MDVHFVNSVYCIVLYTFVLFSNNNTDKLYIDIESYHI